MASGWIYVILLSHLTNHAKVIPPYIFSLILNYATLNNSVLFCVRPCRISDSDLSVNKTFICHPCANIVSSYLEITCIAGTSSRYWILTSLSEWYSWLAAARIYKKEFMICMRVAVYTSFSNHDNKQTAKFKVFLWESEYCFHEIFKCIFVLFEMAKCQLKVLVC